MRVRSARFDEAAETANPGVAARAELTEDRAWVDELEQIGNPDDRSIAAPSPILGSIDESGSDGVHRDIAEGLKHLRRCFLPSRPVAITDEISSPPVPRVEAFGIAAYEAVHPSCERPVWDVEDHMPMGREQADRKTAPSVTRDRRNEEPQPDRTVEVVHEIEARPGCTYTGMLNSGSEITRETRHAFRFEEDEPPRKVAERGTRRLRTRPGA